MIGWLFQNYCTFEAHNIVASHVHPQKCHDKVQFACTLFVFVFFHTADHALFVVKQPPVVK